MSASVDGLVSGMNTTDVINQLMAAERSGQNRLIQQKSDTQDDVTALQAVNSAFASVASLAAGLAKPSSWASYTASSTDATIATASAGLGATSGTFAFHVDQLAKAASQVSSGTVASTSTVVASGPLTITGSDGTSTSIDVGDGSLASVVSAINASTSGVKAAAVQVGPGAYKLQLTSATTGQASSFTVGGTLTGLGSLADLQVGQDAKLTVGSGPAAYSITSASNAVTALPGVTINLKGVGDATITVAPDGSGLADQLQKVVDAVNAARTSITSRSGYDQSTKKAGVLLGETSVQRMLDDLSEAITGSTVDGNPGFAGLSLAKDGSVTFDRTAFLSAFAADPTGTTNKLTQGSRGSGAVQLQDATTKAAAGTYDVVVTAAATQASKVGTVAATLGAQTFQVRVGTTTASYDVTAGQDINSVATGLTQAMATAGLGVVATVEGGALVLRSSAYGSAATFDVQSTATDSGLVSTTGSWEAATAGTDVQGTINGVAANGVGQYLSGAAGSAAEGLTVLATGSGTLSYQPGVLQRLASLATNVTDTSTGSISLLIQGKQSQITSLTGAISDWDLRLQMKQDMLRKQFSDMETALGSLRDQSNWLSGQLAKL